MEKNVARFFELKAAHKSASDKAYGVQKRLWETRGYDYGYHSDPEYAPLAAESMRLWRETDELTGHVIRANLAALGLEDMLVTVAVRDLDCRSVLGSTEMLLSDACCLRYRGVCDRLGVEVRTANFSLVISRDGQPIGRVNSDGDFDFEAAPNLKTALAWKVATDGGRERLIEGFDLDAASRTLLEIIRVFGTERETFFVPYFEALKKVFIYEKSSRFGDGYCGAATTLWHVATRELGQEHEGYGFSY